jgi:hypothetical protein
MGMHIRDVFGWWKRPDFFRWAFISVSGWVLVASFIAVITIVTEWQMDGTIRIGRSLVFEWLCILPWILSTPLLVFLGLRYPLYETFSWGGLGAHLLGLLIVSIFHNLGQTSVVFWMYDEAFNWFYVWQDWIGFLDMRVMFYAIAIAVVWAIHSIRKEQQARLKEAQLATEIQRAQTESEHGLTQPQLIVRSLEQMRSALCNGDVRKAEGQLTRLSDLLRILLRRYRSNSKATMQNPEDGEIHQLLLVKYLQLLEVQYDCPVQMDDLVKKWFQREIEHHNQRLTFIIQRLERLINQIPEQQQIRKIEIVTQQQQEHLITISVHSHHTVSDQFLITEMTKVAS